MESSAATTPAQSEGSLHEVSQQSNIGQSSVSSQPPAHQGKLILFKSNKIFIFIKISSTHTCQTYLNTVK